MGDRWADRRRSEGGRPMRLTNAEDELLERIRAARAAGRTLTPQASELGVDLAGAYRIQAQAQAGRKLAGYKLGLISPAKHAQMGISHPIYGRVFADALLDDPVDLSRFLQPRVEPELAVVLRDDLQPEASPGAAWRAVGATVLAVDVLDSVWQDYRFDIADVVADNASGGGMLLGERALSQPLVGELRLYLDGELLTAGPVSELEPFAERLIWLAGEVGGLIAGQVIFLGSPAAAVQARSGLLEVQGPHGSTIVVRLQ